MIKPSCLAMALVFCMSLIACASAKTGPLPAPGAAALPAEQKAFDPAKISHEVKTATRIDVNVFIQKLNAIIRKKDYEAWTSNLTKEYIAYYSSPQILRQYSEYPILKKQGITLKDLYDYFVYVVYPSRQNDRVDDIEFISEETIRAITLNSKGERIILYMLEKRGDIWKIGIGR